MSRRPSVPAYGLHKASGQARVAIGGRTIYLGKYGSPESHEKYAREIAQLAMEPEPEPLLQLRDAAGYDLTVNEVLVRYLRWADQHYRWKGERTKEFRSIVEALRLLRELYGSTPAREFGPKALKILQAASIEKGWCRKTINARVNRIRRMFKWAASEELIQPSVFHGLSTVTGLQYGRSNAKESTGTQPISEAVIQATLPYVTPQVAAMILIQYHAAMRPAEVTIMRPCDIDMSDPELWVYRPSSFKTAWLERSREVFLGPQCQAALKPFLDRDVSAYLFSPIESDAWRQEQRAEHRDPNRKTKVYPCELRQREKRKKKAASKVSTRPLRDCYDVDSYRRAVAYGTKKAREQGIEIEDWSPCQLRHSQGTNVRNVLGIEFAQSLLGHAKCDVTQIYAHASRQRGIEAAKKLG